MKFYFFKKHFIFQGLTLLLFTSTCFANPVCEDILKLSAVITAKTRWFMFALKISNLVAKPILFPNTEKIDWNTFNALNTLRAHVVVYVEYLKTLSPEQLILERQSIDQFLQEDPEMARIFDQLAKIQDGDYAPTQYKMRVAFFQELIKLMKLLPPEFRPRIARPVIDHKRMQINQEAENFMQDYIKRFDEIFNRTSGYESYAKLEAALRQSRDPHVQKALQMIDQNQINVVIRRPESGRFWVPKSGFQNQFVTGTSRGILDNESRNLSEAHLALTPVEQYTEFDLEFKPKYGTLHASLESGVPNDPVSAINYGPDLYTLKLDAIQNRVSFFMDDSLFYGLTKARGVLPCGWECTFIPWSRRLTMVPLLTIALKNNGFALVFNKNNIDFPLKIYPKGTRQYWETQIFGQITLDMVSSFQFTQKPPEGEFLQELLKRKITIYDGRSGTPVLWRASQ